MVSLVTIVSLGENKVVSYGLYFKRQLSLCSLLSSIHHTLHLSPPQLHTLCLPPPPPHTHTHTGALLGWLVLKDHFGALVYGITFGLIAGMMVFISLKELLPTAQKFDKTRGKLVSFCLVLGMVIMAVSLILFLY